MQPPDETKGVRTPGSEPLSSSPEPTAPPLDDPYGHYQDVYGHDPSNQAGGGSTIRTDAPSANVPAVSSSGGNRQTPPPPDEEESDDGEDGMLRMSFFEHLEELRQRIIYALIGIGVSFGVCLFFANELWNIVSAPAVDA